MNKKQYELSETIDVIEEVLASGGEFKMFPRGTSMLPFIVEGEDSVVLISKSGPLKRNDIAFYRRTNGQFVLHRVAKVEKDGSYVMCGDNQIYLERGIEDSQIIGVMSELYKKERLFDQNKLSHKLYRALWCNITIRKLIRFPKRCVNKLLRILKISKR